MTSLLSRHNDHVVNKGNVLSYLYIIATPLSFKHSQPIACDTKINCFFDRRLLWVPPASYYMQATLIGMPSIKSDTCLNVRPLSSLQRLVKSIRKLTMFSLLASQMILVLSAITLSPKHNKFYKLVPCICLFYLLCRHNQLTVSAQLIIFLSDFQFGDV